MITGIVVNTTLGILLSAHSLTSPLLNPPINTIGSVLDTTPRIQTNVYVVQNGDTLSDIAGKIYENQDKWTTLWNDNPTITDPTNLPVGYLLHVRPFKPSVVEALTPELSNKWQSILAIQQQYTAISTASQSSQVVVASTSPASSNFIADYKSAGAQYNVPWQILYGLHLAESGGRDGAIQNGQGSGAQGPLQFMPGTWNAYKTPDHPNINSAVDGIYVAAKYLAEHGNNEEALLAYGTNVQQVYAIAKEQGLSSY